MGQSGHNNSVQGAQHVALWQFHIQGAQCVAALYLGAQCVVVYSGAQFEPLLYSGAQCDSIWGQSVWQYLEYRW